MTSIEDYLRTVLNLDYFQLDEDLIIFLEESLSQKVDRPAVDVLELTHKAKLQVNELIEASPLVELCDPSSRNNFVEALQKEFTKRTLLQQKLPYESAEHP